MKERVRATCKGMFLCGTVFAFVFGCGLAVRLNAQVVGATITGTMADQSGAVIPNGTIQAKDSATGVASSGTTNASGFYTIPNLTPGAYDVTASAKGFSTQVQPGITLTVGGQQILNWTMKVGQVTQQVQVTGAAPVVNLANAAIGATTFETTVKQLPLNGRSWSDLANLQPGVYSIHVQPDLSIRDRYNRGYGDQISISGARPQQNNYRLDGISINDPTNGAPGSVLGGNLGVDAVAEFSVLTTNYSTEYGRSSGGVINAITKSGTNQFHGDAYEFLRNSSLDAANFFDVSKPPFRRNQFGASAGGPIQKDKTFVFGDYEGLRQTLNLSQVSTVPSVAARSGILSTGNVTVDPEAARYLVFYPLPNQAIAGAPDFGHFVFPRPQVTSENFFIVRLDHTFSEKDSMHGTYSYDFANTVTDDEFQNKAITTLVHRQLVTLEENHVFSPSVFNSARVGFHRYFEGGPGGVAAINPAAADKSFSFPPGNVWTSGQIGVTGLTMFSGGLTAASPQLNHWNDWQAYDELFLTRGVHSIKFGGNIEYIQDNTFSSPRPGGVFLFSTLSDFLTNQPKSLSSDLPANVTPRAIRQSIFGLFIQDDARIKPN
ncbi:MAG: carboxypeptidase regulatory-like domain-containing protein, partial [Terriglobia bacterium]